MGIHYSCIDLKVCRNPSDRLNNISQVFDNVSLNQIIDTLGDNG